MNNMERMEPRHFALPAVFVFSLLAFFFFGITNATPPALPVASPKQPHNPVPPDAIKIVEPPEIEMGDPDLPAKPVETRGGGQLRPTLPDEPRSFGPRDFVVPPAPPSVQPEGLVDKLGIGGLNPGGREGPGTGGRRIVSFEDLDQPPRTRTQTSPVYPFPEKSSGVTGRVEVEFTVDEKGAVVNPWIVSSTGRAFEEPTLRAVEKWRFVPGRHEGKIVRFRMRVPVLFNLND